MRPAARPALRRAPAAARRRSARRPRSSWSTWRRSSTTTCSTPRRCAAGCRPWSPAPAASRAVATGDLLFSRAFAELAPADGGDGDPGAGRQVDLLARASVALARGELAQRSDAFDTRGQRRALHAPLRAEDRVAVRVRLRDRRRARPVARAHALRRVRPRDRPRLPAPRRRARRARPAGADRQGPRAPTCSTGRSRSRSSSPASAIPTSPSSTSAPSTRPPPRTSATGSPRPAHPIGSAQDAASGSPRRRRSCATPASATRELELLRAGRRRGRAAVQLEHGSDWLNASG